MHEAETTPYLKVCRNGDCDSWFVRNERRICHEIALDCWHVDDASIFDPTATWPNLVGLARFQCHTETLDAHGCLAFETHTDVPDPREIALGN
jgi:hypothetical protein